jgi:hypothetical protein
MISTQLLSLITQKIDENASKRVSYFGTLNKGWDSGRGEVMQLGSLDSFQNYLITRKEKFPEGTSVFLSIEGNLIINYTQDNKTIELEFSSSVIEIMEL